MAVSHSKKSKGGDLRSMPIIWIEEQERHRNFFYDEDMRTLKESQGKGSNLFDARFEKDHHQQYIYGKVIVSWNSTDKKQNKNWRFNSLLSPGCKNKRERGNAGWRCVVYTFNAS